MQVLTQYFNWLPWIICLMLIIVLTYTLYRFGQLKKKYLIAAYLDPISQLKNQTAILYKLESLFNSARRYKHALTIGLLAVPYLKSHNKKLEPSIVNHYIAAVSKILQEELRTTDALGRYSHEQFLLILTNTNSHDSRAVFKRIVERLEQLPLQKTPLHYYLGTSNIKSDTPHVSSFIQEAQNALDEALLPDTNNIQSFKI